MHKTLADALLPFLSWTPIVVKSFDEIFHRFTPGKTGFQVEQATMIAEKERTRI
ncbi:MAG: hypothetical protein ABR530_11400 [Pyrinomonadaceae bacterium]